MKKLFAILASTFFILSCNSPKIKVGEPMPNYKEGTKLVDRFYYKYYSCISRLEIYEKNGKRKFNVFYPMNPDSLPFSILDRENKLIYLDYKNQSDERSSDGMIDAITEENGIRDIRLDNPSCSGGII